MSQSSPRPRPSRSTAGTSVQSLGEGDRQPWHPKLESKSGMPEPRPEKPEFLKIRSTSHTGRLLRHHLHWVPWHCRPPLPKPSNDQRGIVQQEQLLYLALYRDKVAKQQAEIAQAAEAATSSSTGRRRGERAAAERAAATASEPPPPNAGGGGPVANAAGAGATPPTAAAAAGLSAGAGLLSEAAAAAEAGTGAVWLPEVPGKLSPWQTEVDVEQGSEAAAETLPPGVFWPMLPEQRAAPRDVGGEGGAQRTRRTARSQQVAGRAPGRGEEEEEGRTSTHIASVSVRAAFGGVTSEHLESKHLGHLFDQWRARQAECNGGEESAAAELLGRGHGHGALPSTPRRAAPSAPSATPSPRRCPAALAAGTALVQGSPRAGLGPAAGAGASASSPRHAAAGSEQGRSRSKASVSTESKRKSPQSVKGSHTVTTDLDLEEDQRSIAGEDQGGTCHSSERRRMDRLFNVITNSKVRCESFAEKGISDLSARPAPSYIEGIPPLHLHHLHQGPWRLSV